MIGNLPQGSFIQGLGQMATTTAPQQPAEPFVNVGSGRLTPDEIARRRAVSQQQMATGMDFSPVGHWTQGLARVAQGLVGGLEAGRLNKADAANKAFSDQILQGLMPKGGDQTSGLSNGALIAAMTDPTVSPQVRELAQFQYERANPKAQAKYYFETNNGSQGVIDPMTGEVKIIYDDPDLKQQWVPDGFGGGNFQPIPRTSQGVMPVGPMPTFSAEDFDSAGGPQSPTAGGF